MKHKLISRTLSLAMAAAVVLSCGNFLSADVIEFPDDQEEAEVAGDPVVIDDEIGEIIEETETSETSEEIYVESDEVVFEQADISFSGSVSRGLVIDRDIDNDALAESYIEHYMDLQRNPCYAQYDYSSVLTPVESFFFTEAVDVLEDIASGKHTGTCFETGSIELTAEELGLDNFDDETEVSEALNSYLNENFDNYRLFIVMLDAFPYELYWFDKTCEQNDIICQYEVRNNRLYLSCEFRLSVAEEYRDADASQPLFTVNDKFGTAVSSALTNARTIINTYTAMDDCTKLMAYCLELCEMTGYNDEAAYDDSYPYGNPWQLIWALDGDPDTDVVCEGYSKAFKYLCDNSNFICRNLYVVTVTGYVQFDQETGGRHMWNVVHMDDGKNYIVDLTNIDNGWELFLSGQIGGSAAEGYLVDAGFDEEFAYYYDEDLIGLYLEDFLILADSDYEYSDPSESDPIAINETNFPDALLREYVSSFDTNGIPGLSAQECSAVTEISMGASQNVTSLLGIEFFTNLQTLTVYGSFAEADLSANTSLTSLKLRSLNLTALDLSGMTSLTLLECRGCTALASVDVSGCTALKKFYCNSCNLEAIDVSTCTALTDLECYENKLTSLNVSNNTALVTLYCYSNSLTELNISSNASLRYLYCRLNPLVSLDISHQPGLIHVYGMSSAEDDPEANVISRFGEYEADGHTYHIICNYDLEVITESVEPGWNQIDGKWYYINDDGSNHTGWLKDGSWYYFDEDGVMQTSWLKIGGGWYYFKNSGAMVTGWQKIGNAWYYFKSGGAMATGWQKISNVWYYFKSGGAMATGWQKISNKWYYFTGSGAMKTGWLKLSGKWYYFESSGIMVTGSKKIGNKTYNFDSNGVCLNP